jgi:hypothetical protein
MGAMENTHNLIVKSKKLMGAMAILNHMVKRKKDKVKSK